MGQRTFKAQLFSNIYSYSLILLLASTLPVVASEYRLVFANPRQINLIDDSTITNEGKDIHKVWLIAIREKNNFLKGKVALMKVLSRIDCRNRMEKVLVSVVYDENSVELTRKETPEKSMHAWVPDTVSEATGVFVCDEKSREKNYSFGPLTLGDLINAVYSGPWPVDK